MCGADAGWLAPDVTGSDEDEPPPPPQQQQQQQQQQPGSGAEGLPGACIKAEEGVDAGVGGQGSSMAETLMQSLVQAYCSGGDASFDTSLVSALPIPSPKSITPTQQPQLTLASACACIRSQRAVDDSMAWCHVRQGIMPLEFLNDGHGHL